MMRTPTPVTLQLMTGRLLAGISPPGGSLRPYGAPFPVFSHTFACQWPGSASAGSNVSNQGASLMQQSFANSQPDRSSLENKLTPAHSTITPATPHVRTAGGYREVVSLAFPLVLSMLSQTIMTAVESAFL